MENCRKHSRVRQWGPAGVVILASLVFWVWPSHAYYICIQPDGSQLITDTPGPNCVNRESPVPPGLKLGKNPNDLKEEKGPSSPAKLEKPGEPPGEQLDFHGHNREWWQDRVRSLKQERNDLSAQILDAKKRLDSISTNMVEVRNSQQRRKIKSEIETLNEMFRIVDQTLSVELPEEARKAGVPPGWLR